MLHGLLLVSVAASGASQASAERHTRPSRHSLSGEQARMQNVASVPKSTQVASSGQLFLVQGDLVQYPPEVARSQYKPVPLLLVHWLLLLHSSPTEGVQPTASERTAASRAKRRAADAPVRGRGGRERATPHQTGQASGNIMVPLLRAQRSGLPLLAGLRLAGLRMVCARQC